MVRYLEEIGPGCDEEAERRGIERRADNLRRCGSWLQFRHYLGLDEVRLQAASFCQQDKLCPLCAIRRGSKLLRRYVEKSQALLATREGLLPYLVTHTIKNGPDLGERFRHLTGSLHTLHERAKLHRCRDRAWTEAAQAVGSVTSIEVKRGEGTRGGGWHPHAHAVWFCREAPDQDKLRWEWKQITRDSHMVDVRPFNFVRARQAPTAELLAADFCEVFKYAVKFSTMEPGDNWQAFELLFKRRLLTARGALHGIPIPDDLLDEPLDVGDEPYVDLVFCFVGGAYLRC